MTHSYQLLIALCIKFSQNINSICTWWVDRQMEHELNWQLDDMENTHQAYEYSIL